MREDGTGKTNLPHEVTDLYKTRWAQQPLLPNEQAY